MTNLRLSMMEQILERHDEERIALRDQFAMAALRAADNFFLSHEHVDAAEWAYKRADAMLKARK